MATKTTVRHPAKYSDALIPLFASILRQWSVTDVLDPMAGVGKIGLLREHGYTGRIAANEIEPEWAHQAPDWVEVHVGDARAMNWAADGEFNAIVTSPTYGNRMADHHNARDASRRYTYRHSIGRPLHPANTGQMHWGDEYRYMHQLIWRECIRVLHPGGIFVVNVKNHIRQGRLVRVSQWHAETLENLGLTLIERHRVDTPGMRNGANAHLRVDGEDVWVFRK